jgi:uncharacterized repeat protein (TIGR01451 family)
MAAGTTKIVRITVRVTASGSFENTARVGSATTDPNLADNRSTARTTVVTARKTADRRTARAGQRVAFTISVRNRGTRTISRLHVCDVLPSRLELVSAPGAKGIKRPCWTVTLAAGRARSFTIVTRAFNVVRPIRVTNAVVLNGHGAAQRKVRLLPPVPGVTG